MYRHLSCFCWIFRHKWAIWHCKERTMQLLNEIHFNFKCQKMWIVFNMFIKRYVSFKYLIMWNKELFAS